MILNFYLDIKNYNTLLVQNIFTETLKFNTSKWKKEYVTLLVILIEQILKHLNGIANIKTIRFSVEYIIDNDMESLYRAFKLKKYIFIQMSRL